MTIHMHHAVLLGMVWTFAGQGACEEPVSPNVQEFERASNKDLLCDAFVGHVRQVLSVVVETAKKSKLTGDARTEALVRAASTVEGVPDEYRPRVLLLALAVAMDADPEMRSSILTKRFWKAYETDAERANRLRVLGKPTMLGREDLRKHFFISAGLTALMTPQAAEAAGILKEVSDANGGSGFSWVDLAADLAGIAYARKMITCSSTTPQFAEEFAVTTFLPKSILTLPEGIMIGELRSEFAFDSRTRFQAEVDRVREHIVNLPIYGASDVEESQSASR